MSGTQATGETVACVLYARRILMSRVFLRKAGSRDNREDSLLQDLLFFGFSQPDRVRGGIGQDFFRQKVEFDFRFGRFR